MIVTRSIHVPTAAERLAAWAYRYKLLHGPQFNRQFTFKAGKQ
ncbi:hypothetical protein [Xanthomonas sp. LMG 12461]|nr:hypothetical protein [Xanthomonas sp. LMG 12461]